MPRVKSSSNRKYSPRKYSPRRGFASTSSTASTVPDDAVGVSTDNSTTSYIRDVETMSRLNGTQMGIAFLAIVSITGLVLVSLSLTGFINFDRITVDNNSLFKGDVTVEGTVHANNFGKVQFHEDGLSAYILEDTNLFIINSVPKDFHTISLPQPSAGKEIDILLTRDVGSGPVTGKHWNIDPLTGTSLGGMVLIGVSQQDHIEGDKYGGFVQIGDYKKDQYFRLTHNTLAGTRLKLEGIDSTTWNLSGTAGCDHYGPGLELFPHFRT